jgi:hypothetical protein
LKLLFFELLKIELSLRPRRPGYLTILGLYYRLNILVQNISDQTAWPYGIIGKASFHVKGTRLNSNRKERLNVLYGVDKRLELQVVPEAPLLHVTFYYPLEGNESLFFFCSD